MDEYESDSVDDVIDISSGSDETDDLPSTSKIQKTSSGKVSLPPCNTLGRKDHIAEATETKNTNPVDESKCSEMSFVTASENSIKHLTATSTFDQTVSSIHTEEKEILLGEDAKVSDAAVVTTIQSDLYGAEEQIEKILPSADFIGVVDVNQYDITELTQNQVTITYELQENLLTGNDINDEEVMEYTVDYAANTDYVNSDLNNALVHPENVDTIHEPIMQSEFVISSAFTITDPNNLTESGDNLNNAVIAGLDTISAVTDSNCEMAEQVNTGKDLTTSDDTLVTSENELVSTEDTQFISTTSDLNAGIIVDTITLQESLTASQNAPETEIPVDTNDLHMTETTSGTLNQAILCNQSEAEFVETVEIVAVESDTASKNVDDSEHQPTEDNQNNEEVVLDIDEILESAVVPDVQKNIVEKVEPVEEEDLSSQNSSTSVDALKKSIAESESKIQNTPRRRLRSNSEASVPTPPKLTRKRSGSFTPLLPGDILKSDTSDLVASPAPRRTRAKSEAKTSSVDDDASRTVRGVRAKSEMKTPTSDKPSLLPIVDSIESTSESIDAIPKKVRRSSTRSINSPAKTPDAGTPQKSTRVTRSRTRSIAEDDDNASIASETSFKSTTSTVSKASRSTRNTRARSHVDDDADDNNSPATTLKKTRSKAKHLPVISEDLTQESEAEIPSYADMRR